MHQFIFISSGSRDVFQHWIHEVPQASWILDSTWSPVHSLEADRVLPGGLPHLQEGRGGLRRLQDEAQREERQRPRLLHRCWLPRECLQFVYWQIFIGTHGLIYFSNRNFLTLFMIWWLFLGRVGRGDWEELLPHEITRPLPALSRTSLNLLRSSRNCHQRPKTLDHLVAQ